jgi:hypothetical protein
VGILITIWVLAGYLSSISRHASTNARSEIA